jgi:hypothetical protein
VGPELARLRIPIALVHFASDLVIRPHAQRCIDAVCHNAEILRLPGQHFALENRPLECAEAIGDRVARLFE